MGMHPRARRGDIRAAILALLTEQPMHGYQILHELSERTGGAWTASPGSVYPALSLLEAQGLVSAREAEGRKVFLLTSEGSVTAAGQEREPWKSFTGPDGDRMAPVRDALDGLISATKLVAHTGTAEQAAETVEVLVEARRRVYRMMADAE
jgi:DNA-binding PadR family transcriptional regulator